MGGLDSKNSTLIRSNLFKVRIMYEDFIKGTKDNSENSTYTGRISIFQEYLFKALNILTGDADFEEDEHHATKRKEFYQVDKLVFLSFKNGPKGQKNRLQRAKIIHGF